MAELNMLPFSLGVTRVDDIKNEYIGVAAHVEVYGCREGGH